ncbi:SepM family pheromone-processing serine protease [Chungangia koreensis]|uniref:endopeptidase La n=1 Tax=Chungangia koreensis TaxID=752657 RepID=A0ABV8X076_9LACT
MQFKRISLLILLTAAVSLLAFYPLNLYIQKPGGAYDLSPIISVEGGDRDDQGSMSLMTVAIADATPISYLWASVADDQEIVKPQQIRRPNEDDREYDFRQLQLMSGSQFNALYVAFSRAGKPFTITYDGVYVVNVLPDGAADGSLLAGDKIVSIDGQPFQKMEELIGYLGEKEVGDTVSLQVESEGTVRTETITLKTIPGTERAGLGIEFTEDRNIETKPSVSINTADIGGPSAGLMFTLEIMNQLLDEDLTKGYKIAGTGEMHTNGEVGRIGGINYKIMAADRAGIEIFFAPDDELSEEVKKRNPDILSNYEEAVKTAEKIGTDMIIVPVKTVDDALNYLDELEPKGKSK